MPSSSFEEELTQRIEGEVRFDPAMQTVYSVDASIFEIKPCGVVLPKHEQDIVVAVQIAKKYKVPVTPRGAATGITGGCLGKGLIIDTSKYMRKILEINFEEEYAVCEPGVVQDQLNAKLAEKGYRLGPETSTGDRATLGGMLANNAAGTRSLRYGKMVDCTEAVDVVLASGEIAHFSPESQVFKEQVKELLSTYASVIKKHLPTIPRRASGYNLDADNLAKVICGSEGTLGIATKIRVKIVKSPKVVGQLLLFFDDMLDAFKAVSPILQFNPLSLEMIDEKILELGRKSPMMRDKQEWLIYEPKALLVAEFDGNTSDEVMKKMQTFEESMKKQKIGFPRLSLINPKKMDEVRAFRKAGLGLLMSKRTYSQAIAFIEDLSIPPKNLPSFMESFLSYLKKQGKEAGIYGHVGSGCMHIRPYMDLREKEELSKMLEIMEDISTLVLEHGGALSGEHGDGLIRSWLTKKMFGEKLTQAFAELKHIFDPENLMNPGKILGESLPKNDLRIHPGKPIKEFETFLDFEKEGGLALSADMCNGNGRCRKPDTLMCPSYQATLDEYDTTRARAQTLRSIIHSETKELIDKSLHQVLDLCLSCKGCKTECPSQVDMAKMKAEALYHYTKKNGIPLRDKLFSNVGALARLPTSLIPNFLLSALGITTKRPLPKPAQARFSKWFAKNVPSPKTPKRVVLFNDTFNEFYSPHIGKAAVSVLQALGYEVLCPKWHCCGRPAFSKGLLKQAKSQAERLIKTLLPLAKQGIPIIGLEPSCILTIKDDYPSLLKEPLEIITSMCKTFDEFLFEHPLNFQDGPQQQILVHGHCHQKALTGMAATLSLLNAIPNIHAEEIPSGCCGVAGSFGYEEEHYALSMKIGELKLLPAVRAASKETVIIANGTSCRSQIEHGSGRVAQHLAELIAKMSFQSDPC